jgi:hypothetical protein
VEWFCGQRETEMRVACHDKSRDLALGYVFHPGVGLYGDLKPPFFNHSRYTIDHDSIVTLPKELYHHASMMVGTESPEMIVVDSSIWDLSNWAAWQNTKVPEERLQQWCDHDLPNLLNHVSAAFTKSRIVFRNAPPFREPSFPDRPWLDNDAVEYMHKCVMASAKKNHGKLYGQYPVIDFYKIVSEMVAQTPHSPGDSYYETARNAAYVWQNDGYHPSKVPARHYVNEILKMVNLPIVEEAEWNRTALGQTELPLVHVPKKEGDEEVMKHRRMARPTATARGEDAQVFDDDMWGV